MRHILQNNSNPRDLIGWYYASLKGGTAATTAANGATISGDNKEVLQHGSVGNDATIETDSTAADGSKDTSGDPPKTPSQGYSALEIGRIANQLFMQSIYLPPILHYGKVFGE